MSTALVLAGHGSHISPETAGIVWGYVDALRRMGVAEEVTAAFWKEQPEFAQVLGTLTAETIVVVPLFTATGFYTNKVIPAAMGLDGTVTQRGSRTIHYTPALGTHPMLDAVVTRRVKDAMQAYDLLPQQTAVAIIGHGTRRSETTRLTTQNQAETIRQAGLAAQVVDAYLDDDPDLPSIYQRTEAQNLVVVPYFLASGSHVTYDVPRALGLPDDEMTAQVQGRHVYYTAPIGTADVILQVILELARATGVSFEINEAPLWYGMPRVGAAALVQAVLLKDAQQRGAVQFGQLRLTPNVVHPVGSSDAYVFIMPNQLRSHIRENPFRPLATSDDLPRDWVVPIDDVQQIPAIVETVYPGALAEWANHYAQAATITPLTEVVSRHEGMLHHLTQATESMVNQLVATMCGRCVKVPLWHATTDLTANSGSLPCLSPCNTFLSRSKEALINEG